MTGQRKLSMLSHDEPSNQPWTEQFERERDRLLAAFGLVADGGIIEGIAHIGGTSVPGLQTSPCVDIGMAVWPFPLEPHRMAALESLGYQIVIGYEDAPEQRFRHSSGTYQLFIAEPGNESFLEYEVMREYLRHDEDARQAFSDFKRSHADHNDAYKMAKAQYFTEMLPSARDWWIKHRGFAPLESVADELKDASFPWFISSGWALDLFLGRVTRVHHDVDIVVPRNAQMDLQKYMTERDWKLVTPFEKRLEPWPRHMQLELPRHQVHAHWEDRFIDFLLTDIEHGVWRYRRDLLIIRAAERMSLQAESGIPFLAPELILLFKSKNTSTMERAKDQADFENVVAHLEPERRAWLHWALLATSPNHEWIKKLGEEL
jgi:GrpB-like predicted nucleotidyltransferase (UPF0157 family)